jgi:uncharacterized protein (DUF2336 family)
MDADELLKIARDKSIEGRERLANVVSDLFLDEGTLLSDKERHLTHEILHHLVHDFELNVRKIISERLSEWPDLPIELVTFLANNDIEVAYPILTKSGLLADECLIEIIQHRTAEHQMAIAIRTSLSEDVTTAIVTEGHEAVIKKLLENENAKISKDTMSYLVEESKRVDTFREPILRRDDLDPKMVQRMFMWVSAALRRYIIENFPLDESLVDEMLEKSAIETFVSMSTSGSTKKISDRLAEDLIEEGEVNASLLIEVSNDGEVPLFLSLFKRTCGLREQLVKKIVFEPGGEGLAIACKALGISKSEFAEIFTTTRGSNPNMVKDFSREIRASLQFYSSMNEKSALQVLKKWRLDSSYLSALRELELKSA